MAYRTDEHRVHLIVYHLIWCPKRRKPVLGGDVARECRRLIELVCREHGWDILELAIQPDHVHLFVRVWPTTAAAEVVRACKGRTSHDLRRDFPWLLRLPSLWTRSVLRVHGRHRLQRHHPALHRGPEGRLSGGDADDLRLPPLPQQGPGARRWTPTLETARRFYNDLLAERKTAYEEREETVGKTAQLRRVKERKATNPYAAGVHSHLLQVVVADLDRAFQALLPPGARRSEAPGYPRFKGRDRFRSVGLKEYGNGFKVDGRRLKVHGIGRLAVRWHRPVRGADQDAAAHPQGGAVVRHLLLRGGRPAAAGDGPGRGRRRGAAPPAGDQRRAVRRAPPPLPGGPAAPARAAAHGRPAEAGGRLPPRGRAAPAAPPRARRQPAAGLPQQGGPPAARRTTT